MGHGAAFDLIHNSPDVEGVTVADFDFAKAEAVAAAVGGSITAKQIDAANYAEIVELFRGHDSVISCVNYWYNVSLSKAAIETGVNFCDLGGKRGEISTAQRPFDEIRKFRRSAAKTGNSKSRELAGESFVIARDSAIGESQ